MRNSVQLIAESLGFKNIAEFGDFTFFLLDDTNLLEGL